ncbi:NAD binding domain of 6-phosphogluconate dehydrogenase family protein [Sphingomonas sp. S17]|jgi:3-hydroxyisobutyrate dehydrogenase-like beta-hydroxyacid dehydrogenase|uniref:NAD(P)-dependent oxidoreductase n=2 Tax=Sphingomonas paucimobilis TaxID=13689 RepID=A0A411LLK8_SPHPI|nr:MULTISPECIES: NAD(P)-dependent oxidoreductase [Sphingomonas]EGI55615.1 NAD binding domain of 6-phosphogluconate dehydrogenase family protein [Sphingomonas sp. S17]MBQ1480725.1 NAD(P)-dependent oxidoreductase [Sphingomonas sp.]MCM3680327.1 NAD(P)-dependent oxidoreductase [Sphingomonas paucimobilis]MDG5970467.1 NAD(P)-dependent oxidoreductase [Sphingomonas paucimobilis]NNG57230.1 NAD(P)-dependent oxidoreductase [Sphingomonas paucimobilis]
MKIGFIGLGQMGAAMASNLVQAGHDVTVWNRSPDKTEPLVAAGATRAERPVDAAQGDGVMTMLADDAALETVVFDADGIAGAPALHIGHSTISLALADRLADTAGPSGYVSAPVFGRPPAAAAGKLFVVAAGDDAALDRCQPLFEVIGQRVFRIGEKPSAANLVKLSGNFMIMAAVEAMAEAMTLAEKNGVDRATLLEVLTGTLFGSPIYQTYGEILVEDRFRPAGFTAPLGLKDMSLVDAAATHAAVPMPLLGIVRDHLRGAIAQEGRDIDWAGIALAVRKGAGV